MEDVPEAQHGIVDEETISVISKSLKKDWWDVGKHLALSDSDLDELESKKNHDMLLKWKQLKGEEATCSKLIDVLQTVNRPDLVTLVKKARNVENVGSKIFDTEGSVAPPTNLEDSMHTFVKELKQTYQRMESASRPVPYLKANVRDVFVDAKVEELEKKEKWGEHDHWNLAGSCRDTIIKNDAERLLLIGDHGSGKSTLSLALAYEWCMAKEGSPMSNVDIFLLISLHKVPNVKSIYRMIKLLLLSNECPITDDTLEKILHNSQRRVILILDDFDKLSASSKRSDIHSIIEGKLFPGAKVVITITPYHFPSLTFGKHVKRVRMAEFDESTKLLYVERVVTLSKSVPEKNKNLVKTFCENTLLGGLCHRPLFFSMFFHLLTDYPELAKQNSITEYYNCMCKRFFNCAMNIDEVKKKEISGLAENSTHRLQLATIAFDDLGNAPPKFSWNRMHLVEKLGSSGYESYKCAGILVEDDIYNESSDDTEQSDTEPVREQKVRFFDKSMQEYYAAHHFVQLIKTTGSANIDNYLRNFVQLNFQFFHLFTCGLDNAVSKTLIRYLLTNGQQEEDILTIMEIRDTYDVKEFVTSILEHGVTINAAIHSKHLQRAKAFIVQIASVYKIPVPSITLQDLFGAVNAETRNLETKDGLQLQPLSAVKTVIVKDEGRVWTEKEFKLALKYFSACDGLDLLKFEACMAPFDVSEDADTLKGSNKAFRVLWITRNQSYFLHLYPFRWVTPSRVRYLGNAFEWLYLKQGIPVPTDFRQEEQLSSERLEGRPLNDSRALEQLTYENIERDFDTTYRRRHEYSQWQRTHISTEPTTRNCVSNAALEKLSYKIRGDWRAIASRLQIMEFFINGIIRGRDTADTTQKIMHDTLKTWKDLSLEHASPQVLEQALRRADQDDVADELNEVIVEESCCFIAESPITREGGKVQIEGTDVELLVPSNALEEGQSDQIVKIKILPHLLEEQAKNFEDKTTVMVQLSPCNLKLRDAARLTLPHCLKLKNVNNSDVTIFRSYHNTGVKPIWEDITKDVKFKLLETACEVHLNELCTIKYTISGNQVEAKRLKWYALGDKCNADAQDVSVEIGYHPDLPGENEVYRAKLQEKFLGDSQSFLLYKDEPCTHPPIELVQVLPVWELRPLTSAPMHISRRQMVQSNEESCSFAFKSPRSSASLPRCVFEISVNPLRPKYRLNVNFRALRPPVTNTKIVTDDILFYLSHKLEDTWICIGRRLQVHESDLQKILKSDKSHQLKSYLILKSWKQRMGGNAFLEHLIEVLEKEKLGLSRELPNEVQGYTARDNAASIGEKLDMVLPKQSFLMNSSDVPADGGLIAIDGTGVELKLRRHSFRNPNEKKKVGIRVLPDRVFQEPAKCFEAYSTTTVEVFPNSLQLEEPARVYLPHCLKLKNAKDCEVRIFQSYQKQGENYLWEDITTTVNYKLSDSSCKIDIKKFGGIKYVIRGAQVEGKRLVVYSLGDNCKQDDNHVTVHIGYHLDLPGHDRVIQEKIEGRFHGDSNTFLCSKKGSEDVEVKCMETEPEWEIDSNDVGRKIPFLNIESSLDEKGCIFHFKRDRLFSNLPRCDFEIFQGKQPERSPMSIIFTLPSRREDDGDWRDIGQQQEVSKHLTLSKLLQRRVSQKKEQALRSDTPGNQTNLTSLKGTEPDTATLEDANFAESSCLISAEGGVVSINRTGVKLAIPKGALQDENLIKLKILPHHEYDTPAKCFEDHSTVMAEILPNNLHLLEPSTLFLPHCLQLKRLEECEVQVFQSHHIKGDEPQWEDVTSSVQYDLSDSHCEIAIKQFCWIKYYIKGSHVEAKRLQIYTAGNICNVSSKRVTAFVGYHPDLPNEDKMFREKTKRGFVGNKEPFLFYKEPPRDLQISLEATRSKWKLLDICERTMKISYANIEASVEQSISFLFERGKKKSDLPVCAFNISQQTEDPPMRIYIDFMGYIHQRDRRVDRVVSEKLLQALSKEIPNDWRTIGRDLGLNEDSISMVIQKYKGPDVNERPLQMLLSWKRHKGKDANRSILRQALLESNRKDIADKMDSDDDDEQVIKSLKGKK